MIPMMTRIQALNSLGSGDTYEAYVSRYKAEREFIEFRNKAEKANPDSTILLYPESAKLSNDSALSDVASLAYSKLRENWEQEATPRNNCGGG